MTTRQRLDLLASAWPEFFPRRELIRLLKEELGDLDALDSWTRRDSIKVRAGAGNLAVSAWTNLAHGLLLGSQNVVKLPGERNDSTTGREIVRFIKTLTPPLRKLITAHDKLSPEILRQADVVVARTAPWPAFAPRRP